MSSLRGLNISRTKNIHGTSGSGANLSQFFQWDLRNLDPKRNYAKNPENISWVLENFFLLWNQQYPTLSVSVGTLTRTKQVSNNSNPSKKIFLKLIFEAPWQYSLWQVAGTPAVCNLPENDHIFKRGVIFVEKKVKTKNITMTPHGIPLHSHCWSRLVFCNHKKIKNDYFHLSKKPWSLQFYCTIMTFHNMMLR